MFGGVLMSAGPEKASGGFRRDVVELTMLDAADTSNLAFTGNLGDGTTRTYSKGITYGAMENQEGVMENQEGVRPAILRFSVSADFVSP